MTDHHHSTAPRSEHVLLDVGDGIGALVVHTGPELHGKEVEISAAGGHGERSHKQVHERRVGGVAHYAAVFDHLDAGAYTLWVDGAVREPEVRVGDGGVTELDWR